MTLALLGLIGLVVLLQLHRTAQIVALASLLPVAAYPFMKRITWWPQAWLGLVFSWAALVGWPAVTGEIPLACLLLYAGAICWVIGYDTIYALQDREDDALVGVKSSALALGRHARTGIADLLPARLALLGLGLVAGAAGRPRPGRAGADGGPSALAGRGAEPEDGGSALATFRSNRFAGLLMFLACLVVGRPEP